jgi:hypothetical protein
MEQHIELSLLRGTVSVAGEETKEPAKVSGLRAHVSFKLPSFAPRVPSPISLFERLRSFCGLMPTWYASHPTDSFLPRPLTLFPSQPSPISLSEPMPFSAAKPLRLFVLVGLSCRMFPNRSKTQSPRSLDPIFLRVTAPDCALHEALEEHC